MLDYDSLWHCLKQIGLTDWQEQLQDLIKERFSVASHGDFLCWQRTIEKLHAIDENETTEIRKLLLALSPWRKGPFYITGITIDSEWRSDVKWDRLKDAITPLAGRNVLDVGSGNGYYALRMREAGASTVVGLDGMLLYVLQFIAVQRFQQAKNVFVLPLRLDELPEKSRAFDTCFSMGVLYHQRFALPHLAELKETLKSGGELVLETLLLSGDDPAAPRPPGGRYARMRNIGELPTIPKLVSWLRTAGFEDIRTVDESVTTVDEQRTTEWMPYESLAEALDPDDPGRTVEGWPAPRRVIVLANAL